MSAGKAVPLAEAMEIAVQLRALLAPACERVAIAGSIRRVRSQVHDVELVAIPKVQAVDAGTLWGATVDVDLLEERITELVSGQELTRRDVTLHRADGTTEVSHRMGPRYKALVYRRLPVDLFIVRPPSREEDFFEAIGQEWIDPPARHVNLVRVQAKMAVPA